MAAPLRARRRPTGPLVVTPRVGTHNLPSWEPVSRPRGWTLDAARDAAERFAAEHAPAVPYRHEAVAGAAFRALATALDTAAGRSASHPQSLRRLDLADRASRVS